MQYILKTSGFQFKESLVSMIYIKQYYETK